MALLATQNLQLHVHSLDHDPDQSDQHASTITMPAEHENTDIKHLSIVASHADHHDLHLDEMDAGPERFVQKISTKVPFLALLLTCLLLLVLVRHISHRSSIRRAHNPLLGLRFHLTPQLRAPPL
jgi:hypothetical protein